MSDRRHSRRRFLQLTAAATAGGLAGCEASVEDPPGGNRTDGGDVTEAVEGYLAIQADLGDALDELDDATQAQMEARLGLRSMIYGAVATGGVERYADAEVPPGMDREGIFDAPRGAVDELAEAGYREHAPESVQALSDATDRHARLRVESERHLAGVAEQAEAVRDYWERHPELFEPEGQGATTVELHDQFAEAPEYLLDSVWPILDGVSVLRGKYPELLADIENQSETVLKECDRDCVEARVNLATGEGQGFNPDDHAWIRLVQQYERTCPGFEPSPVVFVQAKGLYLNEIKSDYGRPIKCKTESWTGACDDPDFKHCQQTIYDQMEDPPMWSIYYNCADWAIDQLRAVDNEMADDLYDQAHEKFITWPSKLC